MIFKKQFVKLLPFFVWGSKSLPSLKTLIVKLFTLVITYLTLLDTLCFSEAMFGILQSELEWDSLQVTV